MSSLNKWNGLAGLSGLVGLKRPRGLRVLLLSCGLLLSSMAWGQIESSIVVRTHPPLQEAEEKLKAASCNSNAISMRLEWARPNQWGGMEPLRNEMFYIHLVVGINENSCFGQNAPFRGSFFIILPTGLELVPKAQPECFWNDFPMNMPWKKADGNSNCPQFPIKYLTSEAAIEVSFNQAPWTNPKDNGVLPGFAALVRVPVIASSPLIGAPLTVNFKGFLGEQAIVLEHAFEPPISVGSTMWEDKEFKVDTIGHNAANIKFLLYNWRKDGNISATLKDKQGNFIHEKVKIWSDLSLLLGIPGQKINDILLLPEQFSYVNFRGLQPETDYALQMHFTTRDATYNSEWFTFRTTPVPRFGVNVDIRGNVQNHVEISPQAQDYALGTEVTLTAHPAPGWELESWSVNRKLLTPSNPLKLTVEENLYVVPNFVETRKEGGCSQLPQNPSWGSVAALLGLALFFWRKKANT